MKILNIFFGTLAILSFSVVIFTLIPYLPTGAPEPSYFKIDLLAGFIGLIGFVILWAIAGELHMDKIRAEVEMKFKKMSRVERVAR